MSYARSSHRLKSARAAYLRVFEQWLLAGGHEAPTFLDELRQELLEELLKLVGVDRRRRRYHRA